MTAFHEVTIGNARLILGDCVAVLGERTGPLFDACVTDPPYHLTSGNVSTDWSSFSTPKGTTNPAGRGHKSTGFMGKQWDGGDVAFRVETWRAVFDQLKPGAYLVAFSGTRTYHRMVVAIEDAGFEIRDQLAWVYGSGFPKSLDVSKAIDKAAGVEREVVGEDATAAAKRNKRPTNDTQCGKSAPEMVGLITAPATPEAARWSGWGTALKPAWEPICLARKPLAERTVAGNVLAHGTGGLNIDACRVESTDDQLAAKYASVQTAGPRENSVYGSDGRDRAGGAPHSLGRFPANLIHDGSEEVEALFPESTDGVAGKRSGVAHVTLHGLGACDQEWGGYGGSGSAARFFYSAKAGPLDRLGSEHPTVKPVDLMRWLVRLVTPPGGLILDPFAGSGTTGIAALAEGFSAELIDLEPAHVSDIETKLAHLRGEGGRIVERHLKRKASRAPERIGPLFGSEAA